MSRRRRFAVIALSLVAVAGMLTSDAAAHGRSKEHGSRSHRRAHTAERVVVVKRPVVVYPRASFTYYRPAPAWCGDTSYMVFNGDPYWYHVGLGVYFGGVDVNVNVGSAPPSGCGYWDPYCDRWFNDACAYSQHCGSCDHERVLRIVRVDDHCGGPRW